MPQLSPVHATSQRQESLHWITSQLFVVVQAISHGPVPQAIGPQARLPEHVMVQPAARSQVMRSQALFARQPISHVKPAGHTTLPQAFAESHTTRQVRASTSHESHGAGQLAVSWPTPPSIAPVMQ